MTERPGPGEMWPCANCGKHVLGSGGWGISPEAVCHCGDGARPIKPSPVVSYNGGGASSGTIVNGGAGGSSSSARPGRTILPQRRSTFTFDMLDEARRPDLTVSYSIFEPPGSPPPHTVSEVFITSRKIGSSFEAIARDAAILMSLALQHGCSLDTIRLALTRNQDGTAQSLMGRVVDWIEQERQG